MVTPSLAEPVSTPANILLAVECNRLTIKSLGGKLLPICGVQGWENRLAIIDSCLLQINLPRRNQP